MNEIEQKQENVGSAQKWYLNETLAKNILSFFTSFSLFFIPLVTLIITNQYQSQMQFKEIEANKVKVDIEKVINETKIAIEKENNKNKLAIEKAINDNKLAQDYIKMAIEILNKPPVPGQNHTRKWAVDIINNYSAVKMSDDTQKSLINLIPLNVIETLQMSMGFMTFKWEGNPKDGYEFEVQKRENNDWIFANGMTLIGNKMGMELERNKEYRWRVKNLTKNTQRDWTTIMLLSSGGTPTM